MGSSSRLTFDTVTGKQAKVGEKMQTDLTAGRDRHINNLFRVGRRTQYGVTSPHIGTVRIRYAERASQTARKERASGNFSYTVEPVEARRQTRGMRNEILRM